MTISTLIEGDDVRIYVEDKLYGIVDYETFLIKVLSPRQFRSYEKNPETTKFVVRKIDLTQALAGFKGPLENSMW